MVKQKKYALSQYDRLKYWKKMGWTAGSVSYEHYYARKMIQAWLMKNVHTNTLNGMWQRKIQDQHIKRA